MFKLSEHSIKELRARAASLRQTADALEAAADGKPIEHKGDSAWFPHTLENYDDFYLLLNEFCRYRPAPPPPGPDTYVLGQAWLKDMRELALDERDCFPAIPACFGSYLRRACEKAIASAQYAAYQRRIGTPADVDAADKRLDVALNIFAERLEAYH